MAWSDPLDAQRSHPRGFGGWVAGRLMLLRPSDRARVRWAVSLLELQPSDRVLDIGCGPGYSTGIIAGEVPQGLVVGVDRSELMAAMAQRRLRGYLAARRVVLVCAEAQDLPRFDVSFDKVAVIDAFRIDDNPTAALGHVRARMTPGGRIAMVVSPRERTASAQVLGGRVAESLRAAGFERPEPHFNRSLSRAPAVCVTARAPA
jgi:cyclopropane fatty-acyl-phospholipid synthase-like methyltransferase